MCQKLLINTLCLSLKGNAFPQLANQELDILIIPLQSWLGKRRHLESNFLPVNWFFFANSPPPRNPVSKCLVPRSWPTRTRSCGRSSTTTHLETTWSPTCTTSPTAASTPTTGLQPLKRPPPNPEGHLGPVVEHYLEPFRVVCYSDPGLDRTPHKESLLLAFLFGHLSSKVTCISHGLLKEPGRLERGNREGSK